MSGWRENAVAVWPIFLTYSGKWLTNLHRPIDRHRLLRTTDKVASASVS